MRRFILMLSVVAGTAYILGARAGRGRFRSMSSVAKHVWDDPAVAKVRRRAYQRIEEATKRVAKRF